MTDLMRTERNRWVRSEDGYLAGVCEGLGSRFGINPWALRALWLVAVFAFGTGILVYFVLAIALPREDRLHEAQQRKLLGVCQRLSAATGLEVGLVRALTVLLAFLSFGGTALVYVALYFVLPDGDERDLVI